MAAQTRGRKKGAMTDEHLQALAKGRSEGSSVRRYLIALETHKPRRGRKRTPESMKKRLTAIQTALKNADPLQRVQLIQERIDIEQAMDAALDTVDIKRLEDDFVKYARTYGERKKISYAAWREAGVDAAVLKRAGIKRSG